MTPRIGMYEEQRGRPRGRSNLDYAILESMILIANKYNLDPKQVIDTFFNAWTNKISHCGSLEISCREVNHDSATFLITKDEKVVWQFPVNLDIIRNQDARDSIKKFPMPEKMKKTAELSRRLKISELRFGMKGINLQAEIVEIPPTKHVYTRWALEASVSNVQLADETGSIRLGLWNDQIKMVHIGDLIDITNCSVARFVDKLQLRLGSKSTMSVIK